MVSQITHPMVSQIARPMEVEQLGQTVKMCLYTGRWPNDMVQQQPKRKRGTERKCNKYNVLLKYL